MLFEIIILFLDIHFNILAFEFHFKGNQFFWNLIHLLHFKIIVIFLNYHFKIRAFVLLLIVNQPIQNPNIEQVEEKLDRHKSHSLILKLKR